MAPMSANTQAQEMQMNVVLRDTLEKMSTFPGQGSVLEQIDKLIRRQQRIKLFQMIESVSDEDAEACPIRLENVVKSNGKKRPMVLRFHLKRWQGYDEVFWQALGDYIIVALHRVKDVDYSSGMGKVKVEYFPKTKGRVRSQEEIGKIIQRLAFMVDREILPTDFTRFRRMNERSDKVGEMSKEQAAVIGALVKLI
jgi:hypothetical protein